MIDNQNTEKLFLNGGISIIGTGSYLPEKILTNHELEKIVETSDEWITTRTGIKERRIAAEGQSTSDLGTEAARRALEAAKITPEELDLIVVATITPDVVFPSTACYIQSKLGAKRAAVFDIAAACSGFVYGLSIARNLMMGNGYKNALVIGTEIMSQYLDWTDRNTCILFGDGAGAAVLQKGEKGKGILFDYLASDGNAADLLYVPAGGTRQPLTPVEIEKKLNCMYMDGKEVYKFAVRVMGESLEHALNECNLRPEDLALLIPHQANIRIIKSSADKFNIPMEKVFVNIDKYGNTSGASIGIALDECVRGGKIKPGDIVVLVAFGAGLTWGSTVIRW